MPAYEYLCDSCGHRFERRQKMSDAEITACPACGGEVRRLISGGAGVIAKGGAASAPAPCGAGECCLPQMSGGCGAGCGCGH
ncbi:MAG: FmdB family zinc ribbon protein [Acidobacteriota bacterium]